MGGVNALDTAVLLVSKLVTNAVVHAQTDIDVCVSCEGHCLTVEVGDESERLPVQAGVLGASTGKRNTDRRGHGRPLGRSTPSWSGQGGVVHFVGSAAPSPGLQVALPDSPDDFGQVCDSMVAVEHPARSCRRPPIVARRSGSRRPTIVEVGVGEFAVDVIQIDDGAVIRLIGELDVATAPLSAGGN